MIDEKTIKEFIKEKSDEQGVDSSIVFSIIDISSRWNELQVKRNSESGILRYGLMQIPFQIGQELGNIVSRNELFDPEFNVSLGIMWLSQLLEIFKNESDAILQYFNGETGTHFRVMSVIPIYRKATFFAPTSGQLIAIGSAQNVGFVDRVFGTLVIFGGLFSVILSVDFLFKAFKK